MRLYASLAICLFAFTSARADQLISSGGFESGTLAGWNATSTGDGGFTVTSAPSTPLTGNATVGPHSGSYYAVSDDSYGSQTQYLTRFFLTPASFLSATLSFSLFINDINGADFGTSGAGAQVALLSSSGSLIRSLFGPTDILEDPGNPNPYMSFSQDIASFLTPNTSYQLQFSSSDTAGLINVGVDDVSLITANASPTPEPSTFALLATGGGFIFRLARRKSMAAKA